MISEARRKFKRPLHVTYLEISDLQDRIGRKCGVERKRIVGVCVSVSLSICLQPRNFILEIFQLADMKKTHVQAVENLHMYRLWKIYGDLKRSTGPSFSGFNVMI